MAPAEFLVGTKSNEDIGSHCLEYTDPEFRSRVKRGESVVVAGKAFGCGSSREQAVAALLGKSSHPVYFQGVSPNWTPTQVAESNA